MTTLYHCNIVVIFCLVNAAFIILKTAFGSNTKAIQLPGLPLQDRIGGYPFLLHLPCPIHIEQDGASPSSPTGQGVPPPEDRTQDRPIVVTQEDFLVSDGF